MYPYQRTPMGNPYIRPITGGYLWVIFTQFSYHGAHTYVNGVHPSLSLDIMVLVYKPTFRVFFRKTIGDHTQMLHVGNIYLHFPLNLKAPRVGGALIHPFLVANLGGFCLSFTRR